MRGLPRADKLLLIQQRAGEVAQEELTGVPAISAAEYPIWTPLEAYEAADALKACLTAAEDQPMIRGSGAEARVVIP